MSLIVLPLTLKRAKTFVSSEMLGAAFAGMTRLSGPPLNGVTYFTVPSGVTAGLGPPVPV
ncbi:hypothetical protein EKH55_5513 [Sinorhizobium alkalisoli]|nr:hypothetical protein EKH55_5513 [Sinorhizobium alkalisoli]